MAVCTNAYISKLLPQYNIQPGRGQVLVTTPLKVNFKHSFHYNKGYTYFRPYGENRILVGGGRNIDMLNETTLALEENPKITNYLMDLLQDFIIPGQQIGIEQMWSGFMAFSDNKLPIIEHVPHMQNVVVGFGCCGMGVSLSPWTAQQTADLLVD